MPAPRSMQVGVSGLESSSNRCAASTIAPILGVPASRCDWMQEDKPAVMTLLTKLARPSSRGELRSASGAHRRCAAIGALEARIPAVDNQGVGPLFSDPRIIWVMAPGEKIYDLFTWDQVLQEYGDGGKVVICHLKPGVHGHRWAIPESDRDCQFVMKIKAKGSFATAEDEARFRRTQNAMLNFPHHPCVMPTHEVLEDDNNYYVVMQRASEGSFFESLIKDYPSGVIPNSVVKTAIRDILDAVEHLHKRGILHRDIKPDNLVVHRDKITGEKRVMLVDFDHADVYTPMERSEYTFGTLRFNAPETFLGEYTPQSDLYSIGVTFYLLMTGRMPYEDSIFLSLCEESRSRKQVYAAMKSTMIDWACSPWPERPLCMDFSQRLLAFVPGMRLQSCEAALQHRWFHDTEDLDNDDGDELH